jgi:hypothetical protein
MKRSMISSLTLTAAMLISSAAWAQTMVGQQNVSAEDLPKVQAQCNTLAAEAKESLGSATEQKADDATGENNGGDTGTDNDSASSSDNGASDMSAQSEVPNGTDQAVTTVDLSLITLEECKAAGLVK